MRYLVAIASDGEPPTLRYRELLSARELRDGDRIMVDDLFLRIRAVLSPNTDEHRALLVCRPETTE